MHLQRNLLRPSTSLDALRVRSTQFGLAALFAERVSRCPRREARDREARVSMRSTSGAAKPS
jgi:hypothetical protein